MNRAIIIAVSGLLLSGCTSLFMPAKMAPIMMGDNVCGREATQIYFGNNEDQLSLTAAQVVSELSNKLTNCPTRKIILLAVSGNDGPAATTLVNDNRLKIVGDILISQGINPTRLSSASRGPLVDAAPRGPIGGVLVLTKD